MHIYMWCVALVGEKKTMGVLSFKRGKGLDHACRQAGAPGYRAIPNGCCVPVTVSLNYETMALYILHPDGAPLKSHGPPMC